MLYFNLKIYISSMLQIPVADLRLLSLSIIFYLTLTLRNLLPCLEHRSQVNNMRYSIKELAKIFSVSIRTLHWYDEIGLLKPASYQENGYRIYEEPQLLLFQQILFFRELGFKLKEIKELLASNECEKITRLSTKKETLEVTVKRLKNLIHTIDRIILKIKKIARMRIKGSPLPLI